MIQYNFAHIAQAAQDISTTNANIESMLQQLKSDIAPMVAEWEGESSTAYQLAQQRWDNAAEELNFVLSTIARAVNESNDRMSQINTSAANSWA